MPIIIDYATCTYCKRCALAGERTGLCQEYLRLTGYFKKSMPVETIQHLCRDCGKPLAKGNKGGRCGSCGQIHAWTNPLTRLTRIRNIRLAHQLFAHSGKFKSISFR